MKFSVCLSTGYEGLAYPIDFCTGQDLVETAVLCEKLGYDGVWGNDHITTQDYVREIFPGEVPNFYEPLITMAMIAQATTKLRIGTALLVLTMREPVYLAKQVTTLDQMSNGRFSMAIGLGAYREEFEAWKGNGIPGAHRGRMFEEGIEAFNKLITEKSATHDGEFYSFTNLEMAPKPRQNPFPLYLGGHNEASLERAAKYGQGWLPGWRPFHEIKERIEIIRNRATELGRNPDDIEMAPQFSLLVGRTQEEAEATYMKSGRVAHRVSLAYTGRDPKHQVTANLVGSPENIIEKIGQLKEMGVNHCAAMVVAVNTLEEFNEQCQWFAEDIMPKV
ncbi:MAG TPA: TIGR03619 family F420-dependent LLM class oxidoreductase [Paracoccaceae bacterium]|nr:TIGR03619 family F420-dependent LLM class oxidoreductase [Paracoccaceae bacterium]